MVKVLFYSLSNSKTMSVTQKGSADPDNQERDQRNQGSRQDMGKDNRNYSKNLIDDEDDEEEDDFIEEGEDMVIEANDKEELANILLDDDEDEDDEDLLDEDHQGGTA